MATHDLPHAHRPGSVKSAVAWWFRDPSTGAIVLWQRPNTAIQVWGIATAVRRLGVPPERDQELDWIATGALTWWSVDEVARGTTPYRRLIGTVVLGWQILRLVP